MSRRSAAAVAAMLALASCTGGDDSTATSESTDAPSSTEQAAPSGETEDTASSPATTTTEAPTATSTTTTTTEPPRSIPVGERWTATEVGDALTGLGDPAVAVLESSIWLIAGRFNGTVAYRSADGGVTWEDRTFVTPPSNSSGHTLRGVVEGSAGRLLAYGNVSSDCIGSEAADDGYRNVGVCQAVRPVIHLSDDDGLSWRELAPAALQPPAGTSVVLTEVVATPNGFAAIGTVRGPDWHARVWESADGENWTVAELRTPGAPTTGRQLAVTGDRAVAVVDTNPCSVPDFIGGPGWVLGTTWPDHPRIFEGVSIGDLALQTPDSHPLAPEPAGFDCAETDQFERAGLPYPGLRLGIGAGRIILARSGVGADGESDTPIDLDIAELVDGEWSVTQASGATVGDGFNDRFDRARVVSLGGEPRLVAADSNNSTLATVRVFGSDDPIVADPPLITSSLGPVAVDGDDLVAAGALRSSPYDSTIAPGETRQLLLWRSSADIGEREACTLEPGASCAFADLSLHPDHPDFAGRDLSGIDLAFADLAGADLSNTNLAGARLWEVTSSGAPADLTGATLAGAQLQQARLGSLDGADLTGAVLSRANVESAVGATFDGAVVSSARIDLADDASFVGAALDRAELGLSAIPDPASLGAVSVDGLELVLLIPEGATSGDLSVAGWDLTGIQISGPSFDGEQRVRITDAAGAIFDATSFYSVDLTALGPDVDLSGVDVWDNSICPDGAPPDDGPIGTCVR